MPEPVLVDNDVAIKVCCYDAVSQFLGALGQPKPLILASAQYVLRDRIARSSRIRNRTRATAAMLVFLQGTSSVEPTQEEVALAADFLEAANRRGLELEYASGEGRGQAAARA